MKKTVGAVIAIVGRPNVGKSTLFNRLSRSRDALVDDAPGITRDRLYATVQHQGRILTLVDTGGYEDVHQDPLLENVRSQVLKAMEEADQVLFLVDGRAGVLPGDREMAEMLRRSQKQTILAVNKVDGPEHGSLAGEFFELGLGQPHSVSAAHGYGVRDLIQAILHDLPEEALPEEDTGQIRVALLGRPNSGKSSLINRILGEERLVVSPIPGTTRDAVDTIFSSNGRYYVLIDTAGIRRKARVSEKIDRFSMIKALKALDRCHVAVVLLDAGEGVSEQDARICGYALERGRGLVLAVNKWDLVRDDARKGRDVDQAIDRQLPFVSHAPLLKLSALTGEGVKGLFRKIAMVYDQCSLHVPTGEINRTIRRIMEKHPPPLRGPGKLRFFYATQTRIRPPTFVLFVNRPEAVHFSYERFLVNQLRADLGLNHAPVSLQFRGRS